MGSIKSLKRVVLIIAFIALIIAVTLSSLFIYKDVGKNSDSLQDGKVEIPTIKIDLSIKKNINIPYGWKYSENKDNGQVSIKLSSAEEGVTLYIKEIERADDSLCEPNIPCANLDPTIFFQLDEENFARVNKDSAFFYAKKLANELDFATEGLPILKSVEPSEYSEGRLVKKLDNGNFSNVINLSQKSEELYEVYWIWNSNKAIENKNIQDEIILILSEIIEY